MFRRTFIALCICVGITITAFSPIAHAETIVVNAQANIFGAGHATPPVPPAIPPWTVGTLPPSFDFPAGPGKVLQFSSVTGTLNCCIYNDQTTPTTNGPDGGTFAGGSTDINSIGGISGLIHGSKTMFLVGVFLDSTEPVDPAPARLDFTGNDNFAILSPALGQVFFIGDGLTGTGTGSVQQFRVPDTATRLFLGFVDGMSFHGDPGFYDDNLGELTVTFHLAADGPLCEVQLNQITYINGDQVIAQVARFANQGTTPIEVEYKFWVDRPGGSPSLIARGGADGTFVLPAPFDRDFGPVTLATVTPELTRGTYALNCRLLHPVTGGVLAEDVFPFTLQ